MASIMRGIADSLAAGLGNVQWTIATARVRKGLWASLSTQDLAVPQIFIMHGKATMTRLSRVTMQTEYTINVFVGRHVSTDDDVNAMLDLADQVSLQLRAHDFNGVTFPTGVSSPQTVTIEINPHDRLQENNVWVAVIEATYIVFQDNSLPTSMP